MAGPRAADPARERGHDCEPNPASRVRRRAARAAGPSSQKTIDQLTPHQREVLLAAALNGVPIDVLAERLNTTRGALYKTLHDARKKLRNGLERPGFDIDVQREEKATT